MKVFKQELSLNYKSLLMWSLGCGLLMLVYIIVYPLMETIDISGMMESMMQSLPAGLVQMFGFDINSDLSLIGPYLGMVMAEMNMVLVIYAAYLGAVTLVKEESEGTLEYLYSMPVSRSRIFIEKLLAIILIFVGFILFNMAICMIGCLFVSSVDMSLLKDIFKIFLGSLFSGLIYMGLGYLASSILRSSRQAIALAIGMVFGTFIMGSMSSVTEQLDWLHYLSPLKYGEATSIINNMYNTNYLYIGFIIIVVCVGVSYFLYNRKDFKL